MPARDEREILEVLGVIADPRSNAELIEASPLYILVDLLVEGLVQRADGQIGSTNRHRVRFVRAPGLHGLLSVWEPICDTRPFHPNIRSTPPHVICSNLEDQLQRGPSVPYLSVVALCYDILAGAQWDASLGVFDKHAAAYYAAASARGELPFDSRTLI